MKDPQLFILLVNFALMVVISVFGWLLRRAIASNDIKVEKAIEEIKDIGGAMHQLQLLISGDYWKRNEHTEFAKRIENRQEQLGDHVHNLRTDTQTLKTEIAMLKTIIKVRNPADRQSDTNHG